MFDGFFLGMQQLTDPYLLFMIFAGTVAGVVVGALPGLSSTMATAILIPFTVGMQPLPAIALLAAIYCSSTFAGSITAILINTPGVASSAPTCLDGFPMAQRGEAGRALGLATVSSTIGGIFSVIVLMIAAPLLARLAYQFGPPEYFALALFSLSMLATVASGPAVKNLIAGTFGVMLATIGLEQSTGVERFMFGRPELSEGISFIPVLIGMFGMSELLVQASQLDRVKQFVALTAVKLPTMADYKKIWRTILQSCGIGTFIGVLPAEGATVAAMIGYNEAKRWSKHKHEFGNGSVEGIAGAEAANNAAAGGAMVPTLALGIPGSGTTAVMLGAFLVLGIRPGPHLFTEQQDFVFAIFGSMLVANVMFFFLGLVGAKVFARLTLVPDTFLWPGVFVLSVIGAYSLDQSFEDVLIMIGSGLLGFVMRRYGFSVVPVAMGLILGELVETTLQQSLIIFDSNWLLFLSRPLVVVFLLLTVVGFCGPLIFDALQRRWKKG